MNIFGFKYFGSKPIQAGWYDEDNGLKDKENLNTYFDEKGIRVSWHLNCMNIYLEKKGFNNIIKICNNILSAIKS